LTVLLLILTMLTAAIGVVVVLPYNATKRVTLSEFHAGILSDAFSFG
jgi:hypothetical protein